jgi:hypothetical protein
MVFHAPRRVGLKSPSRRLWHLEVSLHERTERERRRTALRGIARDDGRRALAGCRIDERLRVGEERADLDVVKEWTESA